MCRTALWSPSGPVFCVSLFLKQLANLVGTLLVTRDEASHSDIWQKELTEYEVIISPFVDCKSSLFWVLAALVPSLKQPSENAYVVRLIRPPLWVECIMSTWGYVTRCLYSAGKNTHNPWPLIISNNLVILRVIGQLYVSPASWVLESPDDLLPVNCLMLPSLLTLYMFVVILMEKSSDAYLVNLSFQIYGPCRAVMHMAWLNHWIRMLLWIEIKLHCLYCWGSLMWVSQTDMTLQLIICKCVLY